MEEAEAGLAVRAREGGGAGAALNDAPAAWLGALPVPVGLPGVGRKGGREGGKEGGRKNYGMTEGAGKERTVSLSLSATLSPLPFPEPLHSPSSAPHLIRENFWYFRHDSSPTRLRISSSEYE